MAQTLIEKLAQKYAYDLTPGHAVRSGDYISIKPAYVMTHDNTGAVIPKFKSIGAKKLAYPGQVVVALDHNVQDKSEKNLEKYKKIEAFAKDMGAHFFPAGRGIGHQIMCEEGFAFPGKMAVASDSHSNMYGGLGCLGTPIVRTDAAAIWATGRTWWQVPPIVKVILNGKMPNGLFGKDLIIALCGIFNNDEILNCAIEFTGEGIKYLSIEDRLSISNMTTEWGAMAGVFPVDSVTIEWLKKRNEYYKNREHAHVHPRINEETITELEKNIPSADKDAVYFKEITIDLSSLVPMVSGPDTVKKMHPVTDFAKEEVAIHKAYLLSCVNARAADIKAAAFVIKGKKVAPGVKLYVAAASDEVQAECERSGAWKDLLDAGAITLPPGCGPCIGLGVGLLEDGEIGISATNRNFKGRMGSPNAKAYLASPAVVAASAVAGKIHYDLATGNGSIVSSIKVNEGTVAETPKVEILQGFPEAVEGEIILCPKDNVNTDGIYPGKYTYNDDMTPDQQAGVVMENYDPAFRDVVTKGDIVVSGFNFGTGSSREQAATALKYRGIQLLVAGSFNETYKRNALNNGFLIIECPKLVQFLEAKFGTDKLTIKTGLLVKINFTNSVLTVGSDTFQFSPVGTAAQELILTGGLENWVAERISS